MKELFAFAEMPAAIFVFCLLYALHMVEEFTLGFVKWADRYLGRFDWTQNLIGNAGFFLFLALACYLYYRDPAVNLWVGMAAAMWVLSNAFVHISATVLSGEYSPGVVTATVLYLPGGIYFLAYWGSQGLLTWGNIVLSFAVGGLVFMLIPTLVRAVHNRARLAQLYHLVK
jgi:hypothetical protein